MGAAMAPAAFETIRQNLQDLGAQPSYYDKIITGDLGVCRFKYPDRPSERSEL